MNRGFFDSDDINELKSDELVKLIIDMLSPIQIIGAGSDVVIITKRRLKSSERRTIRWKINSDAETNNKIEYIIEKKLKLVEPTSNQC